MYIVKFIPEGFWTGLKSDLCKIWIESETSNLEFSWNIWNMKYDNFQYKIEIIGLTVAGFHFDVNSTIVGQELDLFNWKK